MNSATLDELAGGVWAALATGKIGTPVSMRVLAHLSDDAAVPLFAAALSELAAEALECRPVSLVASSDADRRHVDLLVQFDGGRTAMLTITRGRAARPEVHLLLLGNHGVVRLEGSELVHPDIAVFEGGGSLFSSRTTAPGAGDVSRRHGKRLPTPFDWETAIEQSLHEQRVVRWA